MYGPTKLSPTIPAHTLQVKRYSAARDRVPCGLFKPNSGIVRIEYPSREKVYSSINITELENCVSDALCCRNHSANATRRG